jgi:hypothetical protein
MKGVSGLALAIAFGIGAAILNWAYLARKAGDMETVAFVGIAQNVERGAKLEEANLERVEIPESHAGSLKQFAVAFDALPAVIGSRVWRQQPGGSLLLAQDLRTPPQEHDLEEEQVMFVPVDTQSLVPSLVTPGDQVWFMICETVQTPTPAEPIGGEGFAEAGAEDIPVDDTAVFAGPVEIIGPFQVFSVGNRLGSAEVWQAARMPQMQENVIGIRVSMDATGKFDAQTQKLTDRLSGTGFRPASVLWKPAKREEQ